MCSWTKPCGISVGGKDQIKSKFYLLYCQFLIRRTLGELFNDPFKRDNRDMCTYTSVGCMRIKVKTKTGINYYLFSLSHNDDSLKLNFTRTVLDVYSLFTNKPLLCSRMDVCVDFPSTS